MLENLIQRLRQVFKSTFLTPNQLLLPRHHPYLPLLKSKEEIGQDKRLNKIAGKKKKKKIAGKMALLKIIHLTAFLRPQSGVYKICMAFKEFKKFNLPPFSHTSP